MVARPTLSARAISATGVPSLCISLAALSFAGVIVVGHPPSRPRSRAACSPAKVRSRVRSRSNSASAAKTWKISRPAEVVVSIDSCNDRNPTPRASSSWTVSIRCRNDRPSRSSRQTTRVSPGRSASRRDAGRRWPERLWAVEGCAGVGRHLAQRLVADGEPVVDVPAKLSARARVFSTGQGRKTDATDAHSVAVVALRTPGLRQVVVDDATVALRLLADRRDEFGAARTLTVNRLHRLLVELIPGGAKTFLSATQAKALLATVRPRDVVGKTRRKLAAELIAELDRLDRKIKVASKELSGLVEATGSALLERAGPAIRIRAMWVLGS